MSYVSNAEMQIETQEGDINVETSPSNPEPYKEVSINITSYATDLNKAIISWRVDSNTVLSGIGETEYSFTAKGPDIVSTVDITIKPSGSMTTITKTIRIVPSEIEIMWESINGYTPPFYKGKNLPISGGLIKAVAIPNTSTIKSGIGSISYTWKNNENTNLDSSGYNKNSFIFKNGRFDDVNKISVTATSVSGNYAAENSIEIPVYKPKIIFYKKSPTEGNLYNIALNKESQMVEDEMTIVAAPYYMPIVGNEKDLSYVWKINDKTIKTPTIKSELTLRPNSRGGYATVNLVIENVNELFQKVSNQLKLNL